MKRLFFALGLFILFVFLFEPVSASVDSIPGGRRFYIEPGLMYFSWYPYSGHFTLEAEKISDRRLLFQLYSSTLTKIESDNRMRVKSAFLLDSGMVFLGLPGLVVVKTPPLFGPIARQPNIRMFEVDARRIIQKKEQNQFYHQSYIVFYDDDTGTPLYVLALRKSTFDREGNDIQTVNLKSWGVFSFDQIKNTLMIPDFAGSTRHPQINTLIGALASLDSLPGHIEKGIQTQFVDYNDWVLDLEGEQPPMFSFRRGNHAFPASTDTIERVKSSTDIPGIVTSDRERMNHRIRHTPYRPINLEDPARSRAKSSTALTKIHPHPGQTKKLEPKIKKQVAVESTEPAPARIMQIDLWPDHFVYALSNGLVAVVREDYSTTPLSDSDFDSLEIVHILTPPRGLVFQTNSALEGLALESATTNQSDIPDIRLDQHHGIARWTDALGTSYAFHVLSGKQLEPKTPADPRRDISSNGNFVHSEEPLCHSVFAN